MNTVIVTEGYEYIFGIRFRKNDSLAICQDLTTTLSSFETLKSMLLKENYELKEQEELTHSTSPLDIEYYYTFSKFFGIIKYRIEINCVIVL